MTKKETLKKLNRKIDDLIISGKTGTSEYKRLCGLHKRIRG